MKLSLFEDEMTLYMENSKDSIRKLLELISEFSKVIGYKTDTQKSLAFLILTMKNQKEKLRNQSHSPLQQKELSRNKLSKERKELYTENCRTLMKEIKGNINRWRDISCFCKESIL